MTGLLEKVSSPDIARLCERHPEMRKYYDAERRWYDFEQLEAVYLLTEALLADYVGLDVKLDRKHLCPRVANRLDYVEWIRDVVKWHKTPGEVVYGLDIGVGSSCIYPLLGCKVTEAYEDDWVFYGTDVDEGSLAKCQGNITRNGLDNRIKVMKCSGASFFDLPVNENLSFCMANPPFYSDKDDMEHSRERKASGGPHSNELWATDSELYTPGGEVQFTVDMLRESMRSKTPLTWYSTMVGKKSTLMELIRVLREEFSHNNYGFHEIKTGNKTKRWCLVWTRTNLRIRDDLARSYNASLRSLNPFPTLFSLHVPDQSEISFVETLLAPLQPQLEMKLSGNWLEASCSGDVWSRSFRRKVARNEPIPLPADKAYVFRMRIINGHVEVHWLQGLDFKVFESFIGMLKRALNGN